MTESWVQDRTGHRSSDMINRYRRVARTAAELRLGECLPLDLAIPEFVGRKEKGRRKSTAGAPKRCRFGANPAEIRGLATPGQVHRNPLPLPFPISLGGLVQPEQTHPAAMDAAAKYGRNRGDERARILDLCHDSRGRGKVEERSGRNDGLAAILE